MSVKKLVAENEVVLALALAQWVAPCRQSKGSGATDQVMNVNALPGRQARQDKACLEACRGLVSTLPSRLLVV
jgi:hypothetical protein